jgi:hypothetical protein
LISRFLERIGGSRIIGLTCIALCGEAGRYYETIVIGVQVAFITGLTAEEQAWHRSISSAKQTYRLLVEAAKVTGESCLPPTEKKRMNISDSIENLISQALK